MAKTIMVVDDSASIRQVVSLTLKGAGFEVITANDGKDALAKLEASQANKTKINLIITDVNMPKMDGVTFLRNLMRLHPMPAVVISGESVRGSDIF